MTEYLLDTNICVHFIKGEFNLNAIIIRVGFSSCYLSEITIAELLYGVANSSPSRQAANSKRVQDLRTSSSDRIISIGDCVEEYARQKVSLRSIGRRVEDLDIFIGATSIVNNLTLVTRNTKDFINMDGIVLENWIDD